GGLRRTWRRHRVADPLRRGIVRGRQLHPPADGVPDRLVRADAPLPKVPARDRRRLAAEVLRRPDECRLSPPPRAVDEAGRNRRARRLGGRRPVVAGFPLRWGPPEGSAIAPPRISRRVGGNGSLFLRGVREPALGVKNNLGV